MGLIGGIARTAVAAGTWTTVSNRVNRRQQNRWAQQDQQQYAQQQYAQQQYAQQQYAPQQYPQQQYAQQQAPVAQPSSPARDRVDQLKDLADLKQQGILSDQEFEAEKARILGT
jgi:dsDNA-specific endonuclease/ATPase MutS2